ncbi:putative terminase large subunit [Ralstonia phage BHDT_So9]|uniref:Terminase large subunit n=1 Tax=Ralstonia phage BHDT_So9 TaxID=2972464 RepID=A0A9E7QY81_9CAUD|nr:putative terminase large subunit [Ralstonia phage BHDT_So9]UWI83520.1 putative terminase large subunit [Ralstonia phage DLDT_So2]UZT26908.1 hypothetical protein [Ralstonia phage BHDTSo81]WEM03436.1 terminase large subunit [Ralstonia phage BHDT8]
MSSQYDADTLGVIHKAMHEQCAAAKAAGYRWAQLMRPGDGYEAVKAGDVLSVVHEGYLIVYAVGKSWMNAADLIFEELLTLRISAQAGRLSAVTDIFEELAKAHGCKYILTGASTRRSFGRFLIGRGYEESANVYFKELP